MNRISLVTVLLLLASTPCWQAFSAEIEKAVKNEDVTHVYRVRVVTANKPRKCGECEADKNVMHVRSCAYHESVLEVKDQLKGTMTEKQIRDTYEGPVPRIDWSKAESFIVVQSKTGARTAFADTAENWKVAEAALKSDKP